MKYIALISVLFFAFHSFAQSKKKINGQLTAELALTKSKYDSITTLASSKAAQLHAKQRDFAAAQLRNTQRQGTDLMDALAKLEKPCDQVLRLEKVPNNLVNLNDLKAEIARFQKKRSVAEIPNEMLETQETLLVEDTIPVKKRGRKVQNEWLRGEIARYSLAIDKNTTKLNEIDNYFSTIDRLRPELDSIYLSYESVLYDLAIGQAKLLDTIQKLRDFSLRNWPKNFSPVFERAFGIPQRNEISEPTGGEGWTTNVYYTYVDAPSVELEPNFIKYANPIPINEFSVEAMRKQRQVNRFRPDPAVIYTDVDESAEFPGGRVALLSYLSENFLIPDLVKELGMSFKLRMKFVVLEDGSLSDVTVNKGMAECPECVVEAIRVIKNMPKWKPAKLNGSAVKSYYSLPINIHLK